jgi:hypothetical protein
VSGIGLDVGTVEARDPAPWRASYGRGGSGCAISAICSEKWKDVAINVPPFLPAISQKPE